MAGHLIFRIGLSLLTHTSYIAKWLQTYDPFVTTEDAPSGGPDPSWAAPALRQIVPAITSVFTSPNSKTVVVLGETSEATVALFQLAREFSPELVLLLCAFGLVCGGVSVLWLVYRGLRLLYRLWRRLRYGPEPSPATLNPLDLIQTLQLTDTARHLMEFVQQQNPGLLTQPLNTPPRSRQHTRRR